ncbi:N-6 DNA methylase [Pseudooceanicola sp. 216_PA32_1]|uniref:site-specific DNA-methyltransferase (adenine-specific) n=1 Tax=Pseudooceanicola pacificus TaxID=2676438 RepID=A0A844WDV7_9RHOB|nr:N-6 DNA methylase [Pseudooceanicola pacificus]MWB77970.1 N-6 DNA methylase [Pseudooceanicola pacificus]
MNPNTAEIVAKLWREAKTLQGGGVSILHYVNELTYLLFLKMLEETGQTALIPPAYSWSDLSKAEGGDQLRYYRKLLLDLGDPKIVQNPMVLAIFTDAQTAISKPVDLKRLTTNIDKIDWFTAKEDGLGDMYEGLMQKVMSDTKSKAGQYFTPRALIDSIIRLIKPQPGEVIQDPATGTGGFLIAADRYIKDATDDLFKLIDGQDRFHSPEEQGNFQRRLAFRGHEFVKDTRRLCVMNMLLHGIESLVGCEDSCAPEGETLGKADLILTNPPFNKMPGTVNRPDFTLTAGERVGPMPFLEHAVRMLKPGGRCAIVVPDGILYHEGTSEELRRFLMVNCNLHTILRLPTGIFYAQGVKTNVLFFTRVTDKVYPANHKVQATDAVWFYDLRTNMPSFGKTNALTAEHFADFERLFGPDPKGGWEREEGDEESRWRKLTRGQIAMRGDNLDWKWLRDESGDPEDEMTEPDEIAAAIIGHLRTALEEIEGLTEELDAAPMAEAAE